MHTSYHTRFVEKYLYDTPGAVIKNIFTFKKQVPQ